MTPTATLEEQAHELIGQLNAEKLAAVVHLMRVMVGPAEPISDQERRRFHEGQATFAEGKGVPMEEVMADFELKPEDLPVAR
jgi:hypothetical protein